jgi:hypothetical protein
MAPALAEKMSLDELEKETLKLRAPLAKIVKIRPLATGLPVLRVEIGF